MPPVTTSAETSPTLHNVAVQDVQLPHSHGGIRCRLYYPTSARYGFLKRHRRLPHDGSGFIWPSVGARGIVKYAGLPGFLGVFVQIVGGRISGIKNADMKDMKCGIVVFSHGLAANIAGYCRLCEEVCKGGKVVVAIEHAEGSGFGTVVAQDEKKKRAVYFEKRGKGLKGDQKWRREQTRKRIKEVEGVVNWLRSCDEGKDSVVTVRGKAGVSLRGKLDVDRVDVMGHSFGGSSVLGFAIDHPEMCRKVCLMDAWLWPLGSEWIKKGVGANTELLVIKDELSKMATSEQLARSVRGNSVPSERILLKGVSHQVQTDFSYLLPKFVAVRFKLATSGHDPVTLNRINNEACRAFCSGDWINFKEHLVGEGKYAKDVKVSKL